ncbi:MAG: TIR domain-containing protein [Chitinophagales bacterium]
MRTKVFVSYRKEDEKYFRKVRKWAIRQDFGEFDIFMTSSFDKGMRTRTGKLIKGRLERKIYEAKFVIVIVGENNEEHPWRKMDEMSVNKNKKRFYMRIPYTSDILPPEFKDFQQLAYNPNAVEKLMRDWVTLYGEDEPVEPYEPKYKPRYTRRETSSYRPRNDRNDGGYRPSYNRDDRGSYNDRGRDRPSYNRDRGRDNDRGRGYDRDRPSYNSRPSYNNDRDRGRDNDRGRGYDRDRPSYNSRPSYGNDRNRDYEKRETERERNRREGKPYEKKKYYKASDRNRPRENNEDTPPKDIENNDIINDQA